MQSIAFAAVVSTACLTGAWLGGRLRQRLPQGHLDAETRDLIRAGVAFLTTLTAIVLGLIVASAKQSFDQRSAEVQAAAANVALLDAQLRRMGDAGTEARELIRQNLELRIATIWGTRGQALLGPASNIDAVQTALVTAHPTNAVQQAARIHATQLLNEFAQIRSMANVQADSPVMAPLLTLIVCWLAILVTGWNVLAPRNGTVRVSNALIALAAGSAVFLILEMERGFGGVIEVSAAPMRAALAEMKR
jgi:hypothetical protein